MLQKQSRPMSIWKTGEMRSAPHFTGFFSEGVPLERPDDKEIKENFHATLSRYADSVVATVSERMVTSISECVFGSPGALQNGYLELLHLFVYLLLLKSRKISA